MATVIPISGRITNPKLQVWPTVIGVIRNAFVEGVSESYANVTPPEAAKPEDGLKQLVNGLDRNQGPPKAQPEPGASL